MYWPIVYYTFYGEWHCTFRFQTNLFSRKQFKWIILQAQFIYSFKFSIILYVIKNILCFWDTFAKIYKCCSFPGHYSTTITFKPHLWGGEGELCGYGSFNLSYIVRIWYSLQHTSPVYENYIVPVLIGILMRWTYSF